MHLQPNAKRFCPFHLLLQALIARKGELEHLLNEQAAREVEQAAAVAAAVAAEAEAAAREAEESARAQQAAAAAATAEEEQRIAAEAAAAEVARAAAAEQDAAAGELALLGRGSVAADILSADALASRLSGMAARDPRLGVEMLIARCPSTVGRAEAEAAIQQTGGNVEGALSLLEAAAAVAPPPPSMGTGPRLTVSIHESDQVGIRLNPPEKAGRPFPCIKRHSAAD